VSAPLSRVDYNTQKPSEYDEAAAPLNYGPSLLYTADACFDRQHRYACKATMYRVWESLKAALVRHGLGDGTDLHQYYYQEGWEYMGSVLNETPAGWPAPTDIHSFRHRQHPQSERRVYLNAPEVL